MDLSDALFSPSKALQQQAQAKDWIFVDSWLSKKYHPKPVPDFERNEDTLQALMTLVAFNERADEEVALVEKVETQAMKELDEKTYDPLDQTIYSTLQSALSPPSSSQRSATTTSTSALQTIASTSVHLNSPTTSPVTLTTHITNLSTTHFTVVQTLSRISHLQQTLHREQTRLELLLRNIHSSSPSSASSPDPTNDNETPNTTTTTTTSPFHPPPNLNKESTQYTRDTKVLALKLDEYNDRLTTHSTSSSPSPSIQDLAAAEAALDQLRHRLARTEAGIEWFERLPPDVGGARRVLEELKDELRVLVERRDEGFEGLVGGGGGGGGGGKVSRVPVRRG